jgi:hypothetical protein
MQRRLRDLTRAAKAAALFTVETLLSDMPNLQGLAGVLRVNPARRWV